MSEVTYTLEYAKSSRSKCSKCKQKIEKGELRIFYQATDGDRTFSNSTKLECFVLPRKFNHLSMEEFVDEYLDDGTDEKLLEDPSERQVIMEKLNIKPQKKKRKKKDEELDNGEEGFMAAAKRCGDLLGNDDEEDDGQPAKKKVKLSDEDKALGEAYNKFKPLKNDDLKDILMWNNVVRTGTKSNLLTRVIDGYLYGRIAKCAACGKGKPKISDDGSHIICNGFFDSEKGFHIPCGTKSKIKDVKRLPWFHQEPTEEEKEAMEQEDEAEASTKQIPDTMMEAVNNLEWDLSKKVTIRKATEELIEICSAESSPIDFPSDVKKAKMDIGKIVLQNKGSSAADILQLVVEKYGFKEDNEENAKKKSASLASMVEETANAGIYEVMLELSNLYYKEGNANAGTAYKKVAQAIKELDFEITEDNAKGLGKGKTKVAGIGKASADKIYEFFSTGTIQKLEEKRAAAE